jgi:hypothetical protein
VCLDPAQARYSPFFQGLGAAGRSGRCRKVEATCAASALRALSSLAYGYYLSRGAAGAESDPEIRARLER